MEYDNFIKKYKPIVVKTTLDRNNSCLCCGSLTYQLFFVDELTSVRLCGGGRYCQNNVDFIKNYFKL